MTRAARRIGRVQDASVDGNTNLVLAAFGANGPPPPPPVTQAPAEVAVAGAPTPPSLAPGFDPGEVFRECGVCPEMVVIPAGRFTIGSPAGEAGRQDNEGPTHSVTIPQPFAVGKFEVTFAHWDACVSAGGCNGYRPDDQGWGRGDRPVTIVSWDDARPTLHG